MWSPLLQRKKRVKNLRYSDLIVLLRMMDAEVITIPLTCQYITQSAD